MRKEGQEGEPRESAVPGRRLNDDYPERYRIVLMIIASILGDQSRP